MQSSKRDDAYHLKTEAHDIFCSSHGAIFQLKFYADANDVFHFSNNYFRSCQNLFKMNLLDDPNRSRSNIVRPP